FLNIPLFHAVERDRFLVAVTGKRAVFVENVRDTARHTRGKITTRLPEHDNTATGHVLTSVISDAFNHCPYAAVAHSEALSRHAANVSLTTGGAIESDVANDDVVLGNKSRTRRRVDNNLAARETFADVVVGVAFEFQKHAAGDERAEALSGRTLKTEMDRIFMQSFRTKAARDLTPENGAHDTVSVADRQCRFNLLLTLKRGLR